MTFTIGFTGGAGIAILDKPDDQTIQTKSFQPDYPGFVGLATGVGLALELRFLGYFGVEMNVLYASESGSADLTVTDLGTNTSTQFEVDIGHGAVHVPLLLKGAVPGKVATPFFMLGPEFVIPNDDADVELTGINTTATTYSAYTKNYTMFAFGFGLEFNLPTPKVDMRIPLSIRGAYNPGVKNRREDRTRWKPDAGPPLTEESFATVWQYTVRAQLGLSVNF